MTEHKAPWPAPGQHLWSAWMARTGLPKATQYRTCLHPECREVQTREWPK